MNRVTEETRRALRAASRHPRHALSVMVPLVLALTGSAVMFTLVRGVLLEPLPFGAPEQLVQVFERNEARGNDQTPVAAADFYDWKELGSFKDIAAYMSPWTTTLSGSGEPRNIVAGYATYNLFDTLDVPPVAGRLYTATDETSGEDIVVVSSQFAQEMFGSTGAALGKTIVLDDESRQIIGVLNSKHAFPADGIEVYVPISHSERTKQNRRSHMLNVVARLAPDTSSEEVQAELDLAMERIRRDYPDEKAGEYASFVSLHETMVGDVRGSLTILFAAVIILLLIAIANVSGIAIARVRGRQTELAVRRSLGATPWRAVLPVVVEALVLAGLAGLAALGLARVALQVAVGATAEWVPRVRHVAIGPLDAAACIGAALSAGLSVGVIAAWVALRGREASTLRGFGNVATPVTRDRLRATAVVLQVAMSLVMLSGASVLVRSMIGILSTDPGYRTSDIFTVDVALPSDRYDSIAGQNRFFDDLVQAINGLPGVEQAAAASSVPVVGTKQTRSYLLEGEELRPHGERKDYPFSVVTPGYFSTMSIPLLRGRDFGEVDAAEAPPVLIVNEAFVREAAGGSDLLGRRVSFAEADGPWYEIVGIVADTMEGGPETEPEPLFFAPHHQRTWAWMSWMTIVVRSNGDPAGVVTAVRGVIRRLDPALPIDDVMTIEQHISSSLGKRRFQLSLLVSFAALALILTLVGIYALISNALAMRTREVGVRIALGAGPRDVVGIFAREGMSLVGMGLAGGLALSATLMRFLEAMVVRVSPNDPYAIAAAILTLLAVTAVSCYLPARRATRIDPGTVLRAE